MIGLVASRAAVETIVGVTPIPRWTVRLVKARMWIGGNGLFLLFPVALGLGTVGTLALWAFTGDWVLAAAFIPAFAFAEFHVVRELWRNPRLLSRWQTAPVVEYADYPGTYMYVTRWGYMGMPFRTEKIVQALRAVGLTPQVEYFEDDPFLFVELAGRRVYLDHW